MAISNTTESETPSRSSTELDWSTAQKGSARLWLCHHRSPCRQTWAAFLYTFSNLRQNLFYRFLASFTTRIHTAYHIPERRCAKIIVYIYIYCYRGFLIPLVEPTKTLPVAAEARLTVRGYFCKGGRTAQASVPASRGSGVFPSGERPRRRRDAPRLQSPPSAAVAGRCQRRGAFQERPFQGVLPL